MVTLDYANLIQKYLGECNTEAAFTTVNEPDALNNASQIISIISSYLNESVSINNSAVFTICNEMFNVIADKCDEEDVLLDLLEIIPKCSDRVAFVAHLKPLQKVMIRLPAKRLTSYKWGLCTIKAYLEELGLSVDLNNLDDESTSNIVYVYESVLGFYNSLMNNLTVKDEKAVVLLKFIVQLLGRPLAFLDLQEPARISDVAHRIVSMVLHINSNIFSLGEFHVCSDVEKINDLSIGTLYYLVLVEGVCLERIPKIYDHVYIFQSSLILITELCKQEWRFSVQKGLDLLEFVLKPLRALSYQLLEDDLHCEFCKTILNVVVYNSNKKIRTKGTELFHKYLFSFQERGRYLLVYNLMKTLTHTQTIAYLIQQYKDMALESYKNSFVRNQVSEYYSGRHLFVVLDLFCNLPNGEESDLLEMSSRIISSLNLLRFLLKYDLDNFTQVWDYVPTLKTKYLDLLGDGLVVSKQYCHEQLREVTQKYNERDDTLAKISMAVGRQRLPQLEMSQQLNVYYKALNTLDLIESILAWLNDIISR